MLLLNLQIKLNFYTKTRYKKFHDIITFFFSREFFETKKIKTKNYFLSRLFLFKKIRHSLSTKLFLKKIRIFLKKILWVKISLLF